MELLISAEVPLTLKDSGKHPLYRPDIINGLPHARSGI